MSVREYGLSWILAAVLATGLAGCRKTDPPPAHARDLGDETGALIPTSGVWKNAAIVDGKADWHPFRDPADVPEPDDDAATDVDAASEGNAETEAEVRDFIREYNEVVADGVIEEVIEYYVPEQAELIRPILETVAAGAVLVEQIRDELASKLPDASERIAASSGALLSWLSPALRIESIVGTGETEATATMAPGSFVPTYRFVVLDEDWFIQVPDADSLPQIKQAMDGAQTMYNGLLEGLRSGQVTPEDALAALETAAAGVTNPSSTGEESAAVEVPSEPGEQPAAESDVAAEDGD